MNKFNKKFQNLKLNIKFSVVIILFMVVPIGILAGVLFYVMEQNVVSENITYMEYNMERSADSLGSKIDSINMSTQFFLGDSDLINLLKKNSKGETIEPLEWLEFKEYTVTSLEKLVNNNPVMYGVRVYASNDNILEIMPVLYHRSRMDRQAWAEQDNYTGWNYDYEDQIFNTHTLKQNQRLVSYVTDIEDGKGNVIGTIEAAMTMENMVPSMYEQIENEWSIFINDSGEIFYGNEKEQDINASVRQLIVANMPRNGESKVTYLEEGSRKIVVSYQPVTELGGTIICAKDITAAVKQVTGMRDVFVIIMIILLAVMYFFINFIVKSMLKQLYDILGSIRQVQSGKLDVVIADCGNDEMGELGNQINTMLDRIKELMDDNIKRELLMKNSEIRALQNQINAHFIYNVLESIKMMAEINEEYDISDAVTALGKLLRYSMKWTSHNVLVEQEIEYIKDYMKLINLRFDYEIYLSLSIPDYLMKQEIPKMSLQPIVENAIYHGIEEIAEDTNIYIKGFVEDDDCIIEITDPGKGMTAVEIEQLREKIAGKLDSSGGAGNGIGLKNVQDRIQIAFGKKYGLEVASKKGMYTKIKVKIPFLYNVIDKKK